MLSHYTTGPLNIQLYYSNCFLLNCSPLHRTKKALKVVAENWNKSWGIYPNLSIGEPDPNGIINEIHSTKEFINLVKEALSLGASVIGGCCGSNPEHIKLIKNNI